MQIDWDLIRDILMRLEKAPTVLTVLDMKHFDGIDPQMVAYHFIYLRDSDCIDAVVHIRTDGSDNVARAFARQLKPDGHKLLVAIKSDAVWEKIKSTAKLKSMDLAIDFIIKSAPAIASKVFFT